MEGVGGHQEKLPGEISFELRPGQQIRFDMPWKGRGFGPREELEQEARPCG